MAKSRYQIMLENGATEEELRQVLSGGGVAQSYTDRVAAKAAAAAANQPTYSIPSQNFDNMARMNASGGWTIDDSESATWQKIAQMANSGDTQGAINLANQLSAAGKFGGYYDDAGNYWGFAQGYTGGANASMQPVIGGRMLTPKGLEYENTGIWLTPDGKALNLGANGTLTNNGETWGTTNNRNAQAVGRWYEENGYEPQSIVDVVGKNLDKYSWGDRPDGGYYSNPALNTLEGNQKRLAELQSNPNADPAAIAELRSYIQKQQGATTPYQQMLNSYNGTGEGNSTPNQPVSYQQYLSQNGGKSASLSAPLAYDPNNDTLWQKYLSEWGDAKAPEYAGDPYQAQRDQYLQNAANMEWNYNPDTDPVWQAYQKQYRREGQRATEDTLGRYAAMTGGMPSTAAVTAASQAGDYYASQLSDKLPEVYQQAYNRYLQEYQRQLGLSDAYNQYGQTDYNRYLDQLGQFNKDRNFAYGAARDNQSLGRQQTEDQYSRYLDALKQANYEDETAYNRYRDTISDQRYDQEWAQKLRAYADEQNWKATEWQQYLREYGDKLSQQELEWVYKQMQAANDQALDLAKLGAQYGDYSGLSGLGIDTSSAINKNYAYSADGSTYDISSAKGMDFLQNAPIGAAMTGGDGSRWTKNADGTTTITKNGKVWTYGSPAAPATSGSGKSSGGTGRGSGSGSGDNETKSHMEALRAKAPTTYADALDFLMTERGMSYNPANAMARDYIASLDTGDQGSAAGDLDVDSATSGAQNVTPKSVTTRQEAKDWLMSVGIPADIAGRVPDEYEWQREHNTPGSDAYGFTNYVDFLNAYMRYLYANYGG